MGIIVLHNQSLLDIAIKATGKAENAIFIAIANNISITDDLEPGSELIIPEMEWDADVKTIMQLKSWNLQPLSEIKTLITLKGLTTGK